MKKILIFLIIFSQIIFADWDIKYDGDDEFIYITTINTNKNSAWLTIATNGEGVVVFMEFGETIYFSDNVKVEYTLDLKNTKIITGENDASKCILFSTARNEKNLLSFIEELSDSKKLSIKLYDIYSDVYTFTFDISNLEQAFEEISLDY